MSLSAQHALFGGGATMDKSVLPLHSDPLKHRVFTVGLLLPSVPVSVSILGRSNGKRK